MLRAVPGYDGRVETGYMESGYVADGRDALPSELRVSRCVGGDPGVVTGCMGSGVIVGCSDTELSALRVW